MKLVQSQVKTRFCECDRPLRSLLLACLFIGDTTMTVNVINNADGTITCWGKEPMFIPDGGSHVRQCNIAPLPAFAEEPAVTVSISGGQGTEVFLLSDIVAGGPSFTLFKITAFNGLNLAGNGAIPSDFEYVCYFNITGKPL
jgi:hypothetical protein